MPLMYSGRRNGHCGAVKDGIDTDALICNGRLLSPSPLHRLRSGEDTPGQVVGRQRSGGAFVVVTVGDRSTICRVHEKKHIIKVRLRSR